MERIELIEKMQKLSRALAERARIDAAKLVEVGCLDAARETMEFALQEERRINRYV